ncbi:MAG: site-specific integrase [candidate division Zixibacteria bacterium]|nr:site-specific integrase [candidate division Zixibacteria bacterium]
MRRGELLALKWSDIDWNSSHIIVRRSLYRGQVITPKSKYSYRRIVMSPMLNKTLEEHRLFVPQSEFDLVFCRDDGKPLCPHSLVKRKFFPTLTRAGLRRIRFHDLRHTYASLLIAQGENIKFIQNQLGHSSAMTTLDRYGHLMPNAHNEAAEKLDQTVFGNFVRKLLENPTQRGLPQKQEAPKLMYFRDLKYSGGRI